MSGSSSGSTNLIKLQDLEEMLIKQHLYWHYGNVSRSAESLGMSRSTLYSRIKQYKLTNYIYDCARMRRDPNLTVSYPGSPLTYSILGGTPSKPSLKQSIPIR